MNQTKLIEYAYPTSTTAKQAGYYKTGCWFVSLYKEQTINRDKILQFFPTKDEAIKYADTIPNQFNWMHKYFNY